MMFSYDENLRKHSIFHEIYQISHENTEYFQVFANRRLVISCSAKYGGPGEVWRLCSFYQHPLQPKLLCLVSYVENIHRLAPDCFTKYQTLIWNLYEFK